MNKILVFFSPIVLIPIAMICIGFGMNSFLVTIGLGSYFVLIVKTLIK